MPRAATGQVDEGMSREHSPALFMQRLRRRGDAYFTLDNVKNGSQETSMKWLPFFFFSLLRAFHGKMIQMTADEKTKALLEGLAKNGGDLKKAMRLAEISNKNGGQF